MLKWCKCVGIFEERKHNMINNSNKMEQIYFPRRDSIQWQSHPFTHTNLGSNSLVRRKLRIGAKTVGSRSMKICMVGAGGGGEGHGNDLSRSSCPSSHLTSRF